MYCLWPVGPTINADIIGSVARMPPRHGGKLQWEGPKLHCNRPAPKDLSAWARSQCTHSNHHSTSPPHKADNLASSSSSSSPPEQFQFDGKKKKRTTEPWRRQTSRNRTRKRRSPSSSRSSTRSCASTRLTSACFGATSNVLTRLVFVPPPFYPDQTTASDLSCAKDRNIVLAHTYEYRQPSARQRERAAAEVAGSDATTVKMEMSYRYLGLVVVPGEHIVKIEKEDFASQLK